MAPNPTLKKKIAKNETTRMQIAMNITIEVQQKELHFPTSKFSQIIVEGFGAFSATSLYFPRNFCFFLSLNLARAFLHLILSSISSKMTKAYKAGRSRYEFKSGYRFLKFHSEISSFFFKFLSFQSFYIKSYELKFHFSLQISKMTSHFFTFLLMLL